MANLTILNICSWVKENYEVDLSKSSISNCLHDLGFSCQQFTKGVYFDGHEREDVVKDRGSYLKKLESMEKRSWVYNSPCPDPSIHPVIHVYHDESTYYANADQAFFGNDGTKHVLKQKSLGQAIMVSDFVEEVGGMHECDGVKATLYLEHQSDGYFTNDHLIALRYNMI